MLPSSTLVAYPGESQSIPGYDKHSWLTVKPRGQGGATAIEDAVALGVVLESDLKRDEVPARLELFQKIRYERANRIQQYTRIAGGDVKDKSISLNSRYFIDVYRPC